MEKSAPGAMPVVSGKRDEVCAGGAHRISEVEIGNSRARLSGNAARLLRQRDEIETGRRDARLLVQEARVRIEAILHGRTQIDRNDLHAIFDVISRAARLLREAEDVEKFADGYHHTARARLTPCKS